MGADRLLSRVCGTLAAAALLLAAGPVSAETARPVPLALLDFGFVDTSAEPRDQSTEHAARLRLVAGELRTRLEAGGRFILVELTDDPPCPAGDSDCILARAKVAGAEIVLAGAIQKGSSMELKLWAGAFDVATGERVFFRQLGLRGDTDESWRRGARFLATELQAAPLDTRRP